MKKLSIILVCAGIILIIVGLIMPLMALNLPYYPVSTIMGGANHPTYWILFRSFLNGLPYWLAVIGISMLLMALVAWITLKIRKTK